MAEKITWSLAVTVMNGPKTQVQRQHEVEAYDKLIVKVDGKAANSNEKVNVNVQPSPAEDVFFLYLSSDRYGEELTYTVQGAGGVKDIPLDGPQLLAGAGMVGLLGTAPKKIDFRNRLGEDNDAVITILVGRKAV